MNVRSYPQILLRKQTFKGSPLYAKPTEDWNRPPHWADFHKQLLAEGEPWQRKLIIYRKVDLLIRMLTEAEELPRSSPQALLDAGCGIAIPRAVDDGTFHANPKRQRGRELATSLALRVGVRHNRERYITVGISKTTVTNCRTCRRSKCNGPRHESSPPVAPEEKEGY